MSDNRWDDDSTRSDLFGPATATAPAQKQADAPDEGESASSAPEPETEATEPDDDSAAALPAPPWRTGEPEADDPNSSAPDASSWTPRALPGLQSDSGNATGSIQSTADVEQESDFSRWAEARERGSSPSGTDAAKSQEEPEREVEKAVGSETEDDRWEVSRPRPASPGTFKVGLVGGKNTGKSYLFQSLVRRCADPDQSGALTPFLRGGKVELSSAPDASQALQPEPINQITENYRKWQKLAQTTFTEQRWYSLQLHLNNGLARGRQEMDFEFMDGSGEGFFEKAYELHPDLWRDSFRDAKVMIFCLPFWAMFPSPSLDQASRDEREAVLRGFERVVLNYRKMRIAESVQDTKVHTVLALTMADDERTYLDALQRRWIEPFMHNVADNLRRVRHQSNVVTYLENARRISDVLYDELDRLSDSTWTSLPSKIDLGAGRPWLVPVSAINGQLLAQYEGASDVPLHEVPVPVHVELPLLLALAHRHNVFL